MTEPDLFDLSGRHALVTGAAGLLGREFADALASRGAVVHLIDVAGEALDEVATDIGRRAAVRPHAHVVDITDEGQVRDVVDEIGRADILVNSAAIDPKFEPGFPRQGHISTYPLASWEASLRVNLTGAFLLTRECCRVMETQGEAGEGVIVNVSSTYGLRGPDQRIYETGDETTFFKPVDYSVTKAGLLGLTRAVAAMYRDTRIRVNSLTPGGTFNGQDEAFVENYSAKTILGRMALPEDYRGALMFLCSDASSYMTGANLIVDGGWTAF
jgi:NAD(P)-dependent dehydrogenase (short-subunit alcohol dehydrogenase family)